MTNKFERLANWNPPVNRRDPLAVPREQEDGRSPWLLPIRHGHMAANLFAHVRGSAATMAADLIWPANQVRGYWSSSAGMPTSSTLAFTRHRSDPCSSTLSTSTKPI
jgi:hypothetical protein